MKKLTIFDGERKASTITQAGNGFIYIFAKYQIDWREASRLVTFGYKVDIKHPKFLNHVAERAHENDFNTELI